MSFHEIMEDWKPGRFIAFIDETIEVMSAKTSGGPQYEKFERLLLETAWTARRVAELDERLGAEVYGLSLETALEILHILKAK